jgi:hypothetical protein
MAWPPNTHQDVQNKILALFNPAQRPITSSYTVDATDVDMVLHSTAATAVTVMLPSDASAAIALRSAIPWLQYGAGQITFAAGAGATVLSWQSMFRSAGLYADGLVTKVAANTWLVSGILTA